MGIRFQCENCGRKLHVKDEVAGKKGSCPQCKSIIRIPLQSIPEEQMAKVGAKPATPAAPSSAASTAAVSSQAMPAAERDSSSRQLTPAAIPTSELPPATARSSSSTLAGAPSATELVEAEIADSSGSDPDQLHDPDQIGAPPIPGTADPIDEEPEAHWYVRPPAGGQFGPAQGYLMRQWIEEGRVQGQALVWREGWEDWKAAEEAFPELSASSVMAPPSASTGIGSQPASQTAPIPVDESAGKILAYKRKKARANGCAIVAIVFLSLIAVGLAGLLFVILSKAM